MKNGTIQTNSASQRTANSAAPVSCARSLLDTETVFIDAFLHSDVVGHAYSVIDTHDSTAPAVGHAYSV
jgi:hypothetical protein